MTADPLPVIELDDYRPQITDPADIVKWWTDWAALRASAAVLPSVRDDLPGGNL